VPPLTGGCEVVLQHLRSHGSAKQGCMTEYTSVGVTASVACEPPCVLSFFEQFSIFGGRCSFVGLGAGAGCCCCCCCCHSCTFMPASGTVLCACCWAARVASLSDSLRFGSVLIRPPHGHVQPTRAQAVSTFEPTGLPSSKNTSWKGWGLTKRGGGVAVPMPLAAAAGHHPCA
jgi:hypothetical protein